MKYQTQGATRVGEDLWKDEQQWLNGHSHHVSGMYHMVELRAPFPLISFDSPREGPTWNIRSQVAKPIKNCNRRSVWEYQWQHQSYISFSSIPNI